ncbi:uncharacterized protein FFUJ_09520 [Fusarium fujikuroi IMI 58289]|uniref:Uncharacterized protein n=2 Tax=Fusarium fujikuroi TaxID=5127 RepID=S0EMP3_GIBF5|nr:uncharacterized protein FFUJ_09520 [Fusarium fujikuroi IMI 58289]KLO79632.1 uncharacterized protein LW93_13329 [Fusarium fujikuroi]CCT73668.1 uncharacterized protein FFUJ_09520 [Fusarium fujikuroi IMI 58289]SCO10202.1 uncharacterized protein FFM5_09758 [Fusarium fujikuroi]SCO47169.1 uncharacterized protein FFNC_11235 [Fusarium fujikuroi]SCO55898.1 uncharacterized protein FFMR_13054 [Fusarium fujikuroi]
MDADPRNRSSSKSREMPSGSQRVDLNASQYFNVHSGGILRQSISQRNSSILAKGISPPLSDSSNCPLFLQRYSGNLPGILSNQPANQILSHSLAGSQYPYLPLFITIPEDLVTSVQAKHAQRQMAYLP